MAADLQKSQHDSFSSQFEKITGLTEWSLWFVLLTLSSGAILYSLFYDSTVFGYQTADLMYGVIFLLAFVSLSKSFLDAKFLSKETILASKQVKQLVELDDVREFLENSELSIFRNHIDALYTIFQNNSEIRQDSLIELLHARLLARNKIVDLFASILITLGLIGTIIGLIIMVAKLKVELATFDPAKVGEIVGELFKSGGALSGLDTAFYTTLLGSIFGGVVLRILNSVVGANITKYTAHVAELTEINVLPSMRTLAKNLENSGYYERR